MIDATRHRILVIDEDLSALVSIDSVLAREGYPITIVATPADALKAVATFGIDLAIAGSIDPRNAGADFVRMLKDLSPATRVLMLTDSNRRAEDRDRTPAGADGLLNRPFTDPQLLEKVGRMLTAAPVEPPPKPPAQPTVKPPAKPSHRRPPPQLIKAVLLALLTGLVCSAVMVLVVATIRSRAARPLVTAR